MWEQSGAREHKSSRIILPYTQRPLLKEGFGKGECVHEILLLLGKGKGLIFQVRVLIKLEVQKTLIE